MTAVAAGDFTGRVAVVTGAGRGLGRAAAARLHERGASVAVNVRDAVRAADVARSIGPHALGVAADVAADEGPASIVEQTLDHFGRVDILINNAALPLTTRFERISAAEWRQAIEVNLTRRSIDPSRHRFDWGLHGQPTRNVRRAEALASAAQLGNIQPPWRMSWRAVPGNVCWSADG